MTPRGTTNFTDDDFLDQAWDRAQHRARLEVARPYGAGAIDALRTPIASARQRGQRAIVRVISLVALALTAIVLVLVSVGVYSIGQFIGEIAGVPYGGAIAVVLGLAAVFLRSRVGARFMKRAGERSKLKA